MRVEHIKLALRHDRLVKPAPVWRGSGGEVFTGQPVAAVALVLLCGWLFYLPFVLIYILSFVLYSLFSTIWGIMENTAKYFPFLKTKKPDKSPGLFWFLTYF